MTEEDCRNRKRHHGCDILRVSDTRDMRRTSIERQHPLDRDNQKRQKEGAANESKFSIRLYVGVVRRTPLTRDTIVLQFDAFANPECGPKMSATSISK